MIYMYKNGGIDDRLTLNGKLSGRVVSHYGYPNITYEHLWRVDSKLFITGCDPAGSPTLNVIYDFLDFGKDSSIVSLSDDGAIICTSGKILIVEGQRFMGRSAWDVELSPEINKTYTFPIQHEYVSIEFRTNIPGSGHYGFQLSYKIHCEAG